jgi:hypothetical protein
LLDVLLLRMNYGLVATRDRELTHVHAPAQRKERKAFAWVRWADSMVVTFDGNTVQLQGPNFHVHRVLAGLKQLSTP